MKAPAQLERIYKNLAVDYQIHIKRSEFQTLPELIRLGQGYEEKILKHSQTIGNASGYRYQEKKRSNRRRNASGGNNVQKNFNILSTKYRNSKKHGTQESKPLSG